MARKSKLSMMSIESLFKLRDDVAKALSDKASELQKQLSLLGGGMVGNGKRRGRPPGKLKGTKVAPKFRNKKDLKLVWSGRGALPRWMKAEMKGTKLTKDSFAIK